MCRQVYNVGEGGEDVCVCGEEGRNFEAHACQVS